MTSSPAKNIDLENFVRKKDGHEEDPQKEIQEENGDQYKEKRRVCIAPESSFQMCLLVRTRLSQAVLES